MVYDSLCGGERRTYLSSENDNMSDELAGIEFDNDDFQPAEGDDFADFDNFLEQLQ